MTKQMFESQTAAAHGKSTSPTRRRHRVEVARWALANGVPIRRDALSIIVATRDIKTDQTICTTWTCDTVAELLGWRGDLWCTTHHVPQPDRLEESLIGYLRYLQATRLLSDRSDRLEDLLDEIHSLTEATDRGSLLSFDSDRISNVTVARSTGPEGARAGADGRLIQLIPKKSRISASPS